MRVVFFVAIVAQLFGIAESSWAQEVDLLPRYESSRRKLSLVTDPQFGKSVHSVGIERGKTTVIETAFRVTRVAVGDPEIADFIAISDREIEILAREVGDTNMLIWGDGTLQSVIDINVEGVQPHIVRELLRLLDNPSISVDMAGGSVVLRGHVPNLQAYEQAGRIAAAFLSKGRKLIGEQDTLAGTEVINLLQVGGGHQVMLEVVIAELRRNVGHAMGINLMGKSQSGGQGGTFQTNLSGLASTPGLEGSGLNPVGSSTITEAVTLAGSYFSAGSLDLRVFMEAVEANQLGQILAEPTLVARSGEDASFLVGGEVPIPIANSLGAGGLPSYSVQFKKFGVNVEFTPTVLSNGRIHLRVIPEVSEPDFSLGVRVLGSEIPAFQTRRVNTSVELGDGESFVLAGLLREDIIADMENLPFIANVPILGQLFRSRKFQKKQTELVLFVTPHLVQPLAPGTKIELPTDHYIEPTMAEFYWDGRIEGRSPVPYKEDEEDGASSEIHKGEWGAGTTTGKSQAIAETSQELPLDDLVEVADTVSWARENEAPELGGFIGVFGHRLRAPQPVGVKEQ